MPTLPSLSQAFSALGNAFKVPAASQFASPAMPNVSYSSMVSKAPTATSLATPNASYASLSPMTPAVPSLPKPSANYASLAPKIATYSSLSAPAIPNATSVATKQPVYVPPSSTSVPATPNLPASLPNSSTAVPPTPAPLSPVVTTPSGLKVNAQTGGVMSPQSSGAPISLGSNTGNQSSASNYSSSVGGAPTVPLAGSGDTYESRESKDAYDTYVRSLEMSPEEKTANEQLAGLNTAAAQAYTNTQNQPIALPFITGQQAALQRSQATLAGPLEAQLALAQARRELSTKVSEKALDRQDAISVAKRTAASAAAKTAEEARQFDVKQVGEAETRALAAKKFNEDVRQYGMDYALKKREADAKAVETAKANTTDPAKAMDQINLVKSSLARATQIAGASGRSGIRKTVEGVLVGATDYTNLVAETNTLRTNVLTMMTDPTIKKFFGPQMSNADVQLMTSAGTTLNPELQSPENMKSELIRLGDLVARAEAAVVRGTTGGGLATPPAQMRMPDGTVVSRQADGTYK